MLKNNLVSNPIVSRVNHRATEIFCSVALCFAFLADAETQDDDFIMEVDGTRVAFPNVETLPETSAQRSIRRGDWTFSVLQEPTRKVLHAESGDFRVSQSISQNAVFKRFVFDLKRQRFEPMRQEIRIELSDERTAKWIKQLEGVSEVKHFERLGFAIIKIDTEVNPVSVLRELRRKFEGIDARILTGFFDNEPM